MAGLENGLNNAHWTLEDYKQRLTTAQWRKILLAEDDKMIFRGRCRQLVGENLGAGVYEIGKKPLED